MSVVSLQKGQKADLTKGNKNLNKIIIGLGWTANVSNLNQTIDLDASAFLLGSNGQVTCNNDFIFYNKLISDCRSVVHMGDDLEGSSDSNDDDDEQIIVELNNIVDKYKSIVFTVSIHDFALKKQNFGQVKKAYVRIVNADTNQELARYDLPEDFSSHTAIVFGELFRMGNDWKFGAIGQGFTGGLFELCKHFGVDV